MTKGELAEKYFKQGCNCSQAVALAFCREMNLPEDLVKRLTVGFGGGMGRMREVCGAVSGIAFVISAIYDEDKNSIYERIQQVAKEFKRINGSIVCRELLGISSNTQVSPIAEKRTDEYYKKRPCPIIVHDAANILDEYLQNNL